MEGGTVWRYEAFGVRGEYFWYCLVLLLIMRLCIG